MSNFDFIWKDDLRDQQLENASSKVDNFFNEIRKNSKQSKQSNGVKLSYRVGQHQFAKDVMTAIRDNQILLVQAGVGIGKSMGYLIPVFYSFDQIKDFNSIVISTSNIALQQQLLTDLHFVSNMLGIQLNAVIAKGINHYACIKKVNDLINISEGQDKKVLLKLAHDIEKKAVIDRDQLQEVSDEIWQKVQIVNRGACSKCNYSKICLYKNISRQASKADVVITNHGNFVKSVLDDRDYINDADMLIFDEAHKLEEAILGIREDSLNLNVIRSTINYYINRDLLVDQRAVDNAFELIKNVDQLFATIMKKASFVYYHNKNHDQNIKITDCDKIPFMNHGLWKGFNELIKKCIKELNQLIKDVNQYRDYNGYYANDDKICKLKEFLKIFIDMSLGENSKNIYWASYYKNNKICIGYVPKSNLSISKSIFRREIPVVCTSGTLLDAKGSYSFFKKQLLLDEISFVNQAVVEGKKYSSPYDYENNSLFYYDPTVPSPNENYRSYVADLIVKIDELIRITNGRSLILFTSRNTMEMVYRNLKKENYEFDLMMQGEISNSQICRKFEKNVKSCLFATGAFWEGIDISGKSLSNVIITRLPFANVDAVIDYKASEYSKEEAFRMIYLNDMLRKMAQGIGRLIRSDKDKGIICCLDSRVRKYVDNIKKCTPYATFTTNLQDVYDFSSKFITNRDKIYNRKSKKHCLDVDNS